VLTFSGTSRGDTVKPQPSPCNTPPWQLFGQKLLTLNDLGIPSTPPPIMEKDGTTDVRPFKAGFFCSISQPRFEKNKPVSASCTIKTCDVAMEGDLSSQQAVMHE